MACPRPATVPVRCLQTVEGSGVRRQGRRHIVGLYLNPPDGAVVLCVDEKTQVQALDRTQPLLPIDFYRSEKRTHDYVRHGTTHLFAALDAATGQVTARCFPKRRGSEFLTFMKTVAAAYPDRELHVVVDNQSTHTTDEVKTWLARHPRIVFHFTPPVLRGGRWSRSGSGSSPGRPSDAAPSPRSPA
ncbi:IS630 family transposase [Micromonospora sp. RTGN7]|uniref:IS630 family transposase n=1 Tax=Micromonospora sp. RTGN7 TaxID=3016526 RepID=UPI0029FF43F5|nr:IS630 family transposase [Micromonospora sp. RTGN7]